MTNLSIAALARLPGSVVRPGYDPRAIGIGIVHLGLGAFHRAHQAVYTDAVLARSSGSWGISGVSLRSAATRDRLLAQDGLYSLLLRDAQGTSAGVIGSVREALFAPQERERVLMRFADPAVKIVTLTVTEKGYCYDVADFTDVDAPRSTVGWLVAGLARRRAAGAGPMSIVSCDNLSENGRVLASLVAEFADAVDTELRRWIEANVTFPCTMVDRIVPSTQAADLAEAARLLGVTDRAPVVAEPFIQWVIEDVFAADRPHWEDAGAQIVTDVRPYELMKLRILNASHSAMAYLGSLAGYTYVHQVVADPALASYVSQLMREELAPTLAASGLDLERYMNDLLRRFANPALLHRTAQIAMDGSQKLPQRLLPAARWRLERNLPIPRIALAVAAWMRYVSSTSRSGSLDDPLADRLAEAAARANGHPASLAQALLAVQPIFGEDLPRNQRFVAPVMAALIELDRVGVHGAASHAID